MGVGESADAVVVLLPVAESLLVPSGGVWIVDLCAQRVVNAVGGAVDAEAVRGARGGGGPLEVDAACAHRTGCNERVWLAGRLGHLRTVSAVDGVVVVA